MSEEKIIKLLEEIRDLQKSALANQEKSITLVSETVTKQKTVTRKLFWILLGGFILLAIALKFL